MSREQKRHESHALIVSGGTADSRRTAVGALLAGALCLTAEGEPCGTCAACRKVYADGHPDVTRLVPEGKEIVVAQVRRLRADMVLRPHEGRYKLAVIEADALNTHAQNALLAILEEPLPHARFFLLSQTPSLLLPTVRSRCAVWHLPDRPDDLAPGPEARAVMKAVLAGDEWACTAACLALEKSDRGALSAVLDELAMLLREAMTGQDVLTDRRFGSIIDKIREFQAMLEFNAGVGHICGALAAALAQ